MGGWGAFAGEFQGFFGGIGFVIRHFAAVTVAAAGGATPPEVKERGWFPWAASLGQTVVERRPSPGFLFALICPRHREKKE